MSELVDIIRRLKIDLPQKKSAFLWGPRKTGKTTLLTQQFPNSLRYDLLETDLFLKFSKEPYRLREELLAHKNPSTLGPIILDEVQKVPALLDEIHWLIENKKLQFILCGSSARKLKRSHANLLGGRAWRFELYPLTTYELGEQFDLLTALNRGLIPDHYLSRYYAREIKAYIQDYLKEEIQHEGIVRNLAAFARFLDALPFSNAELINYSNIARECGIDSKTVAQYYQILIDTLLGFFLEPFRKRQKRQIISETPKFYFFDVGIVGGLTRRRIEILKGEEFGKAFEHLVFMELMAYRSYSEKDFPFTFWRTKDGHEVDFVVGNGEVAIEVKGSSHVNLPDLKGLRAFIEEHQPAKSIVVSQETVPRILENGIQILPWKFFFEQLWEGQII